MAIYQGALIANNTPPKTAVQGLISKTASVVITAALDVTGNIWQLMKIPAGATVLDVKVTANEGLDSSTGALISVGDSLSTTPAASATKYISSNATVGRANFVGAVSTVIPNTYIIDDIIILTLTAQSTTHALDATIYVTVEYTMDE
jgi:hypothetical protein